MTVVEAIGAVTALAVSQIGYHEGANNWTKYADELDGIEGLTWGKKQNLPWCGEYTLWLFVKVFGVELALAMLCSSKPTSIPLCSAGAQNYIDAGRWYKDPRPGDIVFFYVGGAINHTGIVTAVQGNTIITVEGNSGDMVARRTYAIGDATIAGYGRPRWELAASVDNGDTDNDNAQSDNSAAPTVCTVELPIIRYGDEGAPVRAMQLLLIGRGYACGWYGADGEYGPATKSALVKFQAAKGLTEAGTCGAETWAKLIKGN